ncbi:MAG: hypothetical protein JXB50_05850, partial [Spirochaetes bacterium]|nr:hypothetical protein [Spirochaetota bacterium]
ILMPLMISLKQDRNKLNYKIGEECIYKKYHGTAVIISIKKTKESTSQTSVSGGPGYEGYEIKFSVKVNAYISKEWVKESINKEQLFLLANSWYPGIEYIKKYKIKKGKKHNCIVKIIEKGACTPILFEIDGLDTTDYFESKQ